VHILPGSSSETFPTSSVGTYDVSNTEVEESVVVVDEDFIAITEEAAVRIKQEEIPRDITIPDIKSEPDEVTCVCICLELNTFYHCRKMLIVFL
jgi:hypothetical protein